MNSTLASRRRPSDDTVRSIAKLISEGRDLEAWSALIAMSESDHLNASTRCQLARFCLQIEKTHLARGVLEKALAVAPRSEEVHFLTGLAEKELGHAHETLAHFSQAGPESNPDAAYYLSIVHQELGSLESACEAIQWALSVSAEDADYLNQQAYVFPLSLD